MHVLIAEDDLDFQHSLQDLLEKVGYGVEAVGDGASALERLDRADVLLADIGIPGVSGLELCSRAHSQSPAVNVIIMTGCDTPSARSEASRRGAEVFLAKPFEREVLLAHMKRFEGSPCRPPAVRSRRARPGGGR
jgi:DNA-binding response OmpR family regulator